MAIAKPAYAIPSVAEIRARPSNGLTLVSTFSGAGGSCLGYRWAGYTIAWASEFVEAARNTYLANFPDAVLDARDIRTVEPTDILSATGLEVGQIDILEGSPPCASFSLAGKRDKHWGEVKAYSDTRQRTDDLFDEWIRLVDALQPRVCVAENVPALATGRAVGYWKRITRAISAAGYTVKAAELDARWLGVPQRRKRLFIIGVRSDLEQAPVFPKPLPYWYSIREALSGIDSIRVKGIVGSADQSAPTVQTHGRPQTRSELVVIDEIEGANGFDGHAYYSADQPANTVQASRPIKVLEAMPRFDRQANKPEPYAIYAEWLSLKEGEESTKYRNLKRADSSKVSPTVTQMGGLVGAASVTHPSEPRKFTISELRRICGFPDDFKLTGSYRQQYERLGRAVCPPVAKAVGDALRDQVLA